MSKLLPNRVFDLYYGAPASGKSEAIRQVIEEFHAQTGKRARVCIGDGSRLTYEGLEVEGIADIMEFTHRPYPFEICARICEGWWPESEDINSPLIAPSDQPDFSNVGFYVFEGAGVMGSYIMGHVKGGLADLAGKGIKIGQDSPVQIFQGEKDAKGNVVDGPGTNFGGNPVAHYGHAQKQVLAAVQRSKMLARHVVWTTHEYTNDPETNVLSKDLLVGPEVVGKALTASFQKLFGNTLHFQTVAKRVKVKDEFTGKDTQDLDLDYRIWTRDHFSPDNNTTIRYKAVSRGVRGLDHSYGDILEYYDALVRIQRGLDKEGKG